MRFDILTPAQFRQRYKRLKKHIAPAVSMGNYCLSTVISRVELNKILPVVLVHDNQAAGVMLLEKGGGELHILSIGGKLPPGWKYKTFEWLKQIALDHGCKRIQLQGRRGWRRMLAPLGFRPKGELLVYDMELEQ
jgi:hypothetical protein